MSSINRSLTDLNGVSRQTHEPASSYRGGGRNLDIETKRFIYTALAQGHTNRQIQDALKILGRDVSLATVRNYREWGAPKDLWEDEVIRVNSHGQFSESALKPYGFDPGTQWKISQAEDGTVTLRPV